MGIRRWILDHLDDASANPSMAILLRDEFARCGEAVFWSTGRSAAGSGDLRGDRPDGSGFLPVPVTGAAEAWLHRVPERAASSRMSRPETSSAFCWLVNSGTDRSGELTAGSGMLEEPTSVLEMIRTYYR